MFEFKKLKWMIKKEWLSLYRHPGRLISIIIFPIVIILLFGYGMGGDLTDLPIVVSSLDEGNLTDLTLDTIKENSAFDVVNITSDQQIAKEMVDKGEVKAAILLPSNYDASDTQQKTVVLYLDSSDQMASQVLEPSAQAIFSQISIKQTLSQQVNLNTQNAQITGGSSSDSLTSTLDSAKSTINFQVNKIYGNIKYMDFLVPAILGMTIMMSCIMGMGASIAGERETGELARLFMTPTTVATIIGGKILGKLSVEMLRAVILLVVALLLFGISIKGGIIPTLLLLFLGALCFVGFGIMLSARTRTQEDYIQISMIFSMPMMFISGVFYPIETMPWILQKFAYIFPLTYLNDAMRAVMIQGRTLGDVWMDILVLIGFTLLFYILGVKRFNRDI